MTQCNHQTVLDYKPWLYAAENILYLYYYYVCSTFLIEISCVSDATDAEALTKSETQPGRKRHRSGYCTLHTVAFNMAKINDC